MISLPFSFSDYSSKIFEETIKDYETLKMTNNLVVDTKKKILNSLNKENYLYTNFETPIFTVTSNKYDNLHHELLRNGIISEPCNIF